MSFLWKMVGLGGSIPNFPFKIDSGKPEYIHSTATLNWTIRQGTRIEDGLPVNIFTTPIAKGKASQNPKEANMKILARNALKYSKSLMLPGILRCYGGVEYDNCIYIATERCDPLSNVLASAELLRVFYGDHVGKQYEQGVALGLKHVSEVLIGLEKNGLMHGNVCAETVYVTADGLWRLWGLELVSSNGVEAGGQKHGASVYHQLAADFLPKYRIPDAIGRRNAAVDVWGMACLIFEAFRDRSSSDTDTDLLSSKNVHSCQSQLPDSLKASFKRLLPGKVNMCHSIEEFLESCDFIQKNAYVQSLSDFNQYMLMDSTQREEFMDRLGFVIPEFPLLVCLKTILPKLMGLIEMDTPPVNIVNPVMEIARLVGNDEMFDTHISPCLALLFQSTSLVIRYSLLQSIDVYGSRLSRKTLEKIWPLYAKGVSSTSAGIRDGSVRALVHIAGQLSPRVLMQEVPFLLQQAQADPDGAIRTNATIALSLISQHMPAEVRSKILVSAFGRMLKDPFAPSRIAALQALSTVVEELRTRELSEVVIPRVVPLITDPVADVRVHALAILKNAVARFEADHLLCLEQENAHALPPEESPSSMEGRVNHTARTRPLLGNTHHPPSSSLQSHSESNDGILSLARNFPQKRGPRSDTDTCDGWNDDVQDLKPSKEDNDAKDTDSDGWGEVAKMPTGVNFPSLVAPSFAGTSQGASATFRESSPSSEVPFSGNGTEAPRGPTTTLIQTSTPRDESIKITKPTSVMKLRSKKKTLGAVRLD
ncbi:unnamed protein product [Phytomonas sp. EM1]|nr:unnamed protein product [Phytomonas sp. EM1]|eukprot:CCW62984.1 unnamed protein product [Phytomonas sp. isolate EM1]